MIPHERSLVEEFKDKPFALIGVNTDGQEAYAKGLEQEPVTWRSFDDGDTSGPICEAWNIEAFPTIFLIDHEGVIRHISHGGDEMEQTLRDLIAKAEAAAK